MSVSDERLEILIGKALDGELSPAERRLLDDELGRNSDARAVLQELQALSECGREAVASQVALQPGEAERLFERAWQHRKKDPWHRLVKGATEGRLRFVAGLAAGFVLGLILHFALVWAGTGPSEAAEQPRGVPHLATGTGLETAASRAPVQGHVRPVIRNVDWYSFTDDAGNQWLVEGVREGMVRPAAYQGDLR